MVILCDVDEVLYRLMEEGIELYNSKYVEKLHIEDVKDYIVSKELLDCFGEVKYTRGDKDNSIHYLKKLIAKGHDVYLLTASMKDNVMEKVEWIERHIPELGYEKTIICKNKHMVQGDVIIDDYHKNLICHNAQYKFLIDMPYNRHINDMNIIRVKTLADVYKYIEGV